MDIEVLYEDKDVIVVKKPPKVPSQKDLSGDLDMVSMLQTYLRQEYVGLVHRLDRPVGGVMVFAKNEKACSKLSEQIQSGRLKKVYQAVVCGKPKAPKAQLVDYLVKRHDNTSQVAKEGTRNSKKALLMYEAVKEMESEDGHLSLLHVELMTGRHHQIRVQLAHAGIPIWGDTKYNERFAQKEGWHQIALFAYHLTFKHPVTGKELTFELQPTQEPFTLF